MKVNDKIILYSALAGSVFIIFATYIITVPIPKIESDISGIHSYVERIDNKILRGLMFYIDYKQTELKNRINHLERNSFITHNIGTLERYEVEKRIINSQYFLLEMWSKLYTLDKLAVEDTDILKRADEFLNEQESFEIMNQQLGELLKKCKMAANSRLDIIQERKKEEKKKQKKMESRKECYRIMFIWFQIFGLISLTFSGVLEKISKESKPKKYNQANSADAKGRAAD